MAVKTINILGNIGESVFAKDVIKQIQSAEEETIKMIIASPGGNAFQGLMIYDAAKNSGKKIITVILGLGASAASVVFMAGSVREMGEGALLMVHNSRIGQGGTAAELRERIEGLEAIDKRMKSILMDVSGIDDEEATELLSKDSFMDLQEAKALGIATDSISDNIAAELTFNNKKEPLKMAEMKEKELDLEPGILARIGAYFGLTPKAEKKEEAEAKAEEEEIDEEREVEESKAEGDHEDEEAKAEESEEGEEEKAEDEEEDVEALKAKIAGLEEELSAAKAGNEEEAKAEADAIVEKAGLIFDAMTDDKVTMHEAKNLFSEDLEAVKTSLEKKESNATGRGKTAEPKEDSGVNHYEAFKGIEDEKERGAYYAKYSAEIDAAMKSQ